MSAPKISAAESVVMEALWTDGPQSAEEIVRIAAPAQGWGEATVKTLINRLLKKQAIRSDRLTGRTLYHPLLSREAYLTGESQGLLDRLFGGQLAPLVAHLAQSRSISPEDVARLKRLVASLDDEDD